MSPDEFQKLWVAEGDKLVSFPADRVRRLHIPEDSKTFFISPGLPQEAAPFLTFGTERDQMLQTVSEAWQQPDEFQRYKIIGSDGFGDPICIDVQENGRIVYLNHDNDFFVEFMNSSAPQLAYSALAFREAVKQTQEINGPDGYLYGRIPHTVVDEFIITMDLLDPLAIKDGTFWFRSILGEGI